MINWHIDHNAACHPPPTPPPPQKKNIISFQFLLGIKVIPREIEDYLFIYFLFEEGRGGGGGKGQIALWSM